jgi:hypothetical protein
MNIEQMETAYNRIVEGIRQEFAVLDKEFGLAGLKLLFLDNIKYRVQYNRDLPVDVYDLRVKVVNDNGKAKIEYAEMAVMTDKIKAYIKHNEGLSLKLRAKFRFVLRFEVGHYLYFKEFEDKGAQYKEFSDAMDSYEADLTAFNKLVSVSDFSTRERITKYCEIDFNAWSAERVGLKAETLIEFDNNIMIPPN